MNAIAQPVAAPSTRDTRDARNDKLFRWVLVGTVIFVLIALACAALSIPLECGALVPSSITLGAADDTSRMRFCFEGLTAESGRAPYTPAEDAWSFIARAPYEQSAIDEVLAEVSARPGGYAGLFEAVADALDGDAGREVTLADGRRSLEFGSAVYAPARTRAPVDLPRDEDHPRYAGWLP